MNKTLPPISERWLLTLLCVIQFIHVVDYMMLMPLGPDFAKSLGFPVHAVGYLAAAYAFAAGLMGLIAAFYLDAVARKHALLFCLAGLSVTTIATALVTDLNTMLAARLIAGAFGGPMMGICNAFVADYISPERRGRAMGVLMSVFAIASVLGIPLGLEAALYFGWRAPFIALGGLGMVALVIGYMYLPYYKPFVAHEPFIQRVTTIRKLLCSRDVQLSYVAMATGMISAHLAIPLSSPFLQLNMGVPREDLGMMYLAAGAVTMFTMRAAGILVDKLSATAAAALFSALFAANVYVWFILTSGLIPVIIPFVLFMVFLSARGVAVQTLSSKVPTPQTRGAYMSIQSTIMQFAGAFASYLASVMAVEHDGRLQGVTSVAGLSIALSLVVPLIIWRVERHVRRRAAVEIPPVSVM